LEFRLLYDGQLRAATTGNNRVNEKHEIRKEFHKQLKQLWETHPTLIKRKCSRVSEPNAPTGVYVSLLEATASRYARCGFRFVPLIPSEGALSCAIDILFLRRDHPGNLVKSGGDIDNRMKTLFDALRMPGKNDCNEVGGLVPDSDEDPFYVLLEDDSLITRANISTDRLLRPPAGGSQSDVHLVIRVTVEVIAVTYDHWSNTVFLGA
jgi:hypothetical protein